MGSEAAAPGGSCCRTEEHLRSQHQGAAKTNFRGAGSTKTCFMFLVYWTVMSPDVCLSIIYFFISIIHHY